VKLDITDPAQIKKAAAQANDVDLLINNAGALSPAGVVAGEPDMLMRDMQVNYFGTLNMVHNFVPVLEKKGGGGIANVISVVGLASMPAAGGYSASKAALFSATQGMRAELKAKNIDVYGIFPGPIDTDMARSFEFDKASPESTAENIVKGILSNQEDIFPDPMSAEVSKLWSKDPKGLERQFAAM
jgi:NAD(P)-dependent dehydrogenase (short-subunit alcohol dehydrogenase family)